MKRNKVIRKAIYEFGEKNVSRSCLWWWGLVLYNDCVCHRSKMKLDGFYQLALVFMSAYVFIKWVKDTVKEYDQ